VHTSINYPPDAIGKWSLPILLALIALAVLSFFNFSNLRRPNKERLIANLASRIREEKFEQLYEEADESIRLNVTKERFIQRMKFAAVRLKAIDAGLNFKRDTGLERTLSPDDSILITAVEKLEGDGKTVTLLLSWNGKGNFYNLSVHPENDTPQEYAVFGINGHNYRIGGKLIDW